MKKKLFLPLLILVSTFLSCDQCKKTEAPKIEFGLKVGGNVTVLAKQGGTVVTSEWEGLGINVQIYKMYCDGFFRGPFEYNYTIDNTGQMINSGVGYYSFKMDNTNDYMNIDFFCGGYKIGNSGIAYSVLAPYNGQTAHPYYDISITWDYDLNTIYDAEVKLIY